MAGCCLLFLMCAKHAYRLTVDDALVSCECACECQRPCVLRARARVCVYACACVRVCVCVCACVRLRGSASLASYFRARGVAETGDLNNKSKNVFLFFVLGYWTIKC